ncbi:hypothetical protein BGZ49_008079 [Haplosporangium sp. Z 27]|nr:hypothetical protein BGZ49_008079 [Haplosporangium sp. Z 27]
MPQSRNKQDSRPGSTSGQHSDPTGRPIEYITHNTSNSRNAIPRGNGYHGMSFPMPASSLVNFSLLSNNGKKSEDNSARSSSDRTRPGASDNRPSKQASYSGSDPSTPSGHHSISFNPLAKNNSSKPNKSFAYSKSAPNSRPSSTLSTPGEGPIGPGDYNNFHTIHHHFDHGSMYPLSMTYAQRATLSAQTSNKPSEPRKRGFDMSIFDPVQGQIPASARPSIDQEERNIRKAMSRQPSIESFSSSNSVPFAPPPPPPPSAWKRFTSRFTQRVIQRHVKFAVALYVMSLLILIRPIGSNLGPAPYIGNVGVVFFHPARTVGAQLEVSVFSIIGALIAAAWVIPCQVAVAAFNQKYLLQGNNAAWAIDASWFFIGVWIMTSLKTRYAKLSTTFLVFTIIVVFTLTKNHKSMQFQFSGFVDIAGILLLGIGISQIANILLWPETASESLGRALHESLDSSRALLGLSTRSFLLNHKTIALPKTAIEKAQDEVRTAQKKLFTAYKEARYELTYSFINPADYKRVQLILSTLMRHLGSMSLVVQNERLLMLGHPDRDDDDLFSQSDSDSESESEDSDSEEDDEVDWETNQGHSSYKDTESGQSSRQQSDYFGTAVLDELRKGHQGCNKETSINTPKSEGFRTPRKRSKRKSSTAELRRVRQLLQRAENTTKAAVEAKRLQQERQLQEALQQQLQFDRGAATAPSSPDARGSMSVYDFHHTHRAKPSSFFRTDAHEPSTKRPFPFNHMSPVSSRPSSIHEDQNQETVKSIKSLFSIKAKPKFKPERPVSLKAGFKAGQGHEETPCRSGDISTNPSVEYLPGLSIDTRYKTMPTRPEWHSENNSPDHSIHRSGGSLLRSTITAHQAKKTAEAYRKKREKEAKREQKKARKAADAERRRTENEKKADAAANAMPTKEVAFGDRKLFMSFLDIVHDPLQRLSDTCSRVMIAMERGLVSGLSAERDRLERIKMRNAQRTDAIRAAEARVAADKKAAENGATANPDKTRECQAEGLKANGHPSGPTVLSQFLEIVGIKPPQLTAEDIAYAEVLKASMEKENDMAVKSNGANAEVGANSNSPLKQSAQRNAVSGADSEYDFAIPSDMTYVEYLEHELDIFDKAEAEGLRNFISTHPTLDVGPREELFLIFFFLFALREIACELLRLGKYVEKLEEQELKKMQDEGHLKPRKKLWWPKVMGNFWRWVSWGSYSQVKTSEGLNSVRLNTTKNMESKQPRTVEEEEAILKAKAVKAATAEEIAKKAAEKAALEKQAQHRRRRHSEMWDLPSLHRSITVSALVSRGGQAPDLERGLKSRWRPRGRSQEPRSRSASPELNYNSHSDKLRHRLLHLQETNHNQTSDKYHETKKDLTNLSGSDGENFDVNEVHNSQLGDDMSNMPSRTTPKKSLDSKEQSEHTGRYTVVEIPDFETLHHSSNRSLKHFEDVNLVDLHPRINTIRYHGTAPPELDISRSRSPKRLNDINEASEIGEDVMSVHTLKPADHNPPNIIGGHTLSHSPDNLSNSEVDHHRCTESDNLAMNKPGLDRAEKKGVSAIFKRHTKDISGQGQNETNSQSPGPTAPLKTIKVVVKKPKPFRYRVWEFLQPFKSDAVKFGFKMAASLSLIGLWSWLQWDSKALVTDRGQWSMMTVMAVLTPTIGATFTIGIMRIMGTIVGVAWAIVTYLADPINPYVICAMMLPITLVSVYFMLLTTHPKLGLIIMLSYSSITFSMYEGLTAETIYQIAYKRAATVIIGLIIAIIVNSLLWPILARRQLRTEIAVLIGRQGVLFAELINKFLPIDPSDRNQGLPSENVESSQVDNDDDSDDEIDTDEDEQDGARDNFVERAEREEREEYRRKAIQEKKELSANSNSLGASRISEKESIKTTKSDHQNDNRLVASDPDRQAFQHVEQQLQTKLMQINELLVLSESEPKLKEEFPVKLYKKVVKCCQNILDRMVSMRMAAQLLSPEVRELISSSMNICRRDLRLVVIFSFKISAASISSFGKNGSTTYDLQELLAILIKPLVGVTIVISSDTFSLGVPPTEANPGPQQSASQMSLGKASVASRRTQNTEDRQLLLRGGYASMPVQPYVGPGMVNLDANSTTEVASGASVVRRHLQNQHKEHIQGRQVLEEYQRLLEEQHQQHVQLLRQMQTQKELIEKQQQQLQKQKQQLDCLSKSDPSSALPEISINHLVPVMLHPDGGPSDTSSNANDRLIGVVDNSSQAPVSDGVNFLARTPIMVMDESILDSRQSQRFQEAMILAQEASGEQIIEIQSPQSVQAQVPTGVTSSASAASRRKRRGTKSSDTSSLNEPTCSSSKVNAGDSSQHHAHRGSISSHQSHTTASTVTSRPIHESIETADLPFGSDFIPEAPIPLYLIPSQVEQSVQRSSSQEQNMDRPDNVRRSQSQ